MVFLRKCDTGADGDLGANDTVPSEEGWGEDVHGTTLSIRHADLAAEEFANDTGDRTATKNGKRMTAIGSDHKVVLGNRRCQADRDGFLHGGSQHRNDGARP